MLFMRMPRFIFLAAVMLISFLPLVSSAEIVTSTNFTVKGSFLKQGSGFATSSSFRLWSAIGEEAIGLSTTTRFNIKAGFLYVPGSISVATTTEEAQPTPAPVTVVTGGGGGGSYAGPTQAVLSGRAYPKSAINILLDGLLKKTVKADNLASFSVSFDINPGLRTFGVYSSDERGRRSLTYTLSFNVNSGTTANVSGIFLSPTIEVDKTEVRRGEPVGILGQTAPESDVTLLISSEDQILETIKAGVDGSYFFNVDSGKLDYGDHAAKSQSSLNNILSQASQVVSFKVGTKTVKKVLPGDSNKDGRVNITDFNILLFWWNKTTTQALDIADIDEDKRVDLKDLSIMLFYWTG